MEKQSVPNYYAIIPAFIRYADINNGAKLLYGEISALCNKEGYCWASNEYFARLYKCDVRTITRLIASLISINAIKVENSANQYRKIFLVVDSGWTKMSKQAGQKCPTGLDKNVRHNSIVNTKTNKEAVTSTASASLKGKNADKEASPIIDFTEEMEGLQNDKRRDLQVVGLYMEFRKASLQKTIHNKAQLSMFIKRHLKSAGTLVKAEYTDDQIVEYFEETNKKNKDIDWTIETVIKQITK